MLQNQTFGRLTLIETYKGAKNKHPTALCLCVCGEKRIVRLSHLRNAKTIECAKCAKLRGIRHWKENRLKLNPDESAFRRLVDNYRNNARKKSFIFTLSQEDCRRLFKSNCFYCGKIPSSTVYSKDREGKFIYNGIDRKDNDYGYVAWNVVSCCSQCNYAKRNLTINDFKDWVNQIHHHLFGEKI